MATFNALMRVVFDALLFPFRGLPAWVGLVPISALVSVAALLAFKWTSNQEALERVKRRIHAGIFEIRLFNDDMRAIARAQLDILAQVLRQLGLTLVPLLWMIVPFAILVPQLQFHYGYSGLRPGEETLVKAHLIEEAGAAERPDIRLEAPTGVRLEVPALWIPLENEIVWRVAAVAPGRHELALVDGAGTVLATKSLVVSDRIVRRSPRRVRGLWGQIAYPAEAPLPADSPFREISVIYPEAQVGLLWWETHWIIAFLVFTVAFAYALRGPMKVTF